MFCQRLWSYGTTALYKYTIISSRSGISSKCHWEIYTAQFHVASLMHCIQWYCGNNSIILLLSKYLHNSNCQLLHQVTDSISSCCCSSSCLGDGLQKKNKALSLQTGMKSGRLVLQQTSMLLIWASGLKNLLQQSRISLGQQLTTRTIKQTKCSDSSNNWCSCLHRF